MEGFLEDKTNSASQKRVSPLMEPQHLSPFSEALFTECYLLSILASFMLSTLHAVAQLVEALCYKSEGRGFDSRWFHWNFSLT